MLCPWINTSHSSHQWSFLMQQVVINPQDDTVMKPHIDQWTLDRESKCKPTHLQLSDIWQRCHKHMMVKRLPPEQMSLGKLASLKKNEAKSLSLTLYKNQRQMDQRSWCNWLLTLKLLEAKEKHFKILTQARTFCKKNAQEIRTRSNKWDLMKLNDFSISKEIVKWKDGQKGEDEYLEYTKNKQKTKQQENNPFSKLTSEISKQFTIDKIVMEKKIWKDVQLYWHWILAN